MRRLHGGLLAAALMLAAGCGSGRIIENASPPATAARIRTPTLAVSSQVSAAAKPHDATFTVLVTSPEGVSAPGLDAAVSVLLERPEFEVVAVARAERSAGTDRHTMSGFPVHVVAPTATDPVAVAVEQLGLEVDLVVVGVVEGTALGTGIESSRIAASLQEALRLGIPALAVSAGTDHGADLAAAGLLLRSLVDVDLETLLEPGARVLNVPSCDGGLVRGPIAVRPSASESRAGPVDCNNADRHEPADDVEAHRRGFATLVGARTDPPASLAQAIP